MSRGKYPSRFGLAIRGSRIWIKTSADQFCFTVKNFLLLLRLRNRPMIVSHFLLLLHCHVHCDVVFILWRLRFGSQIIRRSFIVARKMMMGEEKGEICRPVDDSETWSVNFFAGQKLDVCAKRGRRRKVDCIFSTVLALEIIISNENKRNKRRLREFSS